MALTVDQERALAILADRLIANSGVRDLSADVAAAQATASQVSHERDTAIARATSAETLATDATKTTDALKAAIQEVVPEKETEILDAARKGGGKLLVADIGEDVLKA